MLVQNRGEKTGCCLVDLVLAKKNYPSFRVVGMSAGWSGEGAPSAPEPWLTDPPHQAKVFTLAGFVAGPNRPAHQVGQAKERVMKMNGEHQIATG